MAGDNPLESPETEVVVHACPPVVVQASPLRRCLACRQLFPRTMLIRLLHERQSGLVLPFAPGQQDTRRFGRSAYLCPSLACLRLALKGRKIHKALKTPIPDDIVKWLQDLLKGPESGG